MSDTRVELVAELDKILGDRSIGATKRRRVESIRERALRGEFHDFKSPNAAPKVDLVTALSEAGIASLAARVRQGDFDEAPDDEDRRTLFEKTQTSAKAEAEKVERSSRTVLRDISETLKVAAGPGIGFAVFLSTPAQIDYASNAQREDVVKMLRDDWIPYRSAEVARHERRDYTGSGTGRPETARERSKRFALERKCAEIAKTMLTVEHVGVVLFLFELGPGGNLAYYVSDRQIEKHIVEWVDARQVIREHLN